MTTTIENCIAYNNEGYPQKFCGNIYVGCVMNDLEFGDDINRGKCLEYVFGLHPNICGNHTLNSEYIVDLQ